MRTTQAGRADIQLVAADSLRGLADLAPAPSAGVAAGQGWFYARYAVRGDRLSLYRVDTARLAHGAIDDAVDADVTRTRNELHVFVHGSPARLLELVRREPIFEHKPSLELRRGAPAAAEGVGEPARDHPP